MTRRSRATTLAWLAASAFGCSQSVTSEPGQAGNPNLALALDDGADLQVDLGGRTSLPLSIRGEAIAGKGKVTLQGESESDEVRVHFENEDGQVVSEIDPGRNVQVVVTSEVTTDGDRTVVPPPRAALPVVVRARRDGANEELAFNVSTGPIFYDRLLPNQADPRGGLFSYRTLEVKTGTILLMENPGTPHGIHSGGFDFPHMNGRSLSDFARGMRWNPPANALYDPGAPPSGAEPFRAPFSQEFYCHEHGPRSHGGSRMIEVVSP